MRGSTTFAVVIMLLLAFATPAIAGGKILLVHSYHTGYPWVDAITEGVQTALKDSDCELEVFYMDTKRRTSEEWKIKAGELAAKKVEQIQPDVVIAVDDNAQQYFARNYAGSASPQFAFCGVNAEASKYDYPASNITGVLERPHFKQTVQMLQSMDPSIKKIVVLSDKSPTSEAFYQFMQTETVPAEVVAWLNPATFEDWQAAVTEWQDKADAMVIVQYHTVKTSDTPDAESMEPVEVMAWTIANYAKPTAAVQAFGVADGCVCGVVESGQEHGFTAATFALKMIRGAKAGDIEITTAKEGLVLLNLRTAEMRQIHVPTALIRSANEVYKD